MVEFEHGEYVRYADYYGLLEPLKELLFASAGLVEDKYLRDAREVIAKAEGR